MNLLIPLMLAAALQSPVTRDSAGARAGRASSTRTPVNMDTAGSRAPLRAASKTLPALKQKQAEQEVQLVEYSDGYATRATLHKYSSYTMLPVFALQYYSGTLLLRERDGGQYAPEWAHNIHGPLAIGMAGLFTVNTVTGVWNYLEARHDPVEQTRRKWHARLMLAADVGFMATALLAPPDPEMLPVQPVHGKRHWHRIVGVTSMGAAVASYTIMLPYFRKD